MSRRPCSEAARGPNDASARGCVNAAGCMEEKDARALHHALRSGRGWTFNLESDAAALATYATTWSALFFLFGPCKPLQLLMAFMPRRCWQCYVLAGVAPWRRAVATSARYCLAASSSNASLFLCDR